MIDKKVSKYRSSPHPQGAHDWAVSRSRFWGTPMPIWRSEDGEEAVVVGSIAELESLTGAKVTDLHRPRANAASLRMSVKSGAGMQIG